MLNFFILNHYLVILSNHLIHCCSSSNMSIRIPWRIPCTRSILHLSNIACCCVWYIRVLQILLLIGGCSWRWRSWPVSRIRVWCVLLCICRLIWWCVVVVVIVCWIILTVLTGIRNLWMSGISICYDWRCRIEGFWSGSIT